MTQGTTSKPKMTPEDMINFFTEEAHHCIIDEDCTKAAESALLVHGKKDKRSKTAKTKKGAKPTTNKHCDNCGKDGHIKENCWAKGGGKEGQGPKQRKLKKDKTSPQLAAVAEDKLTDDNLFAFTCTSGFSAITESNPISANPLAACIDSDASSHYCPDRSKFINYR